MTDPTASGRETPAAVIAGRWSWLRPVARADVPLLHSIYWSLRTSETPPDVDRGLTTIDQFAQAYERMTNNSLTFVAMTAAGAPVGVLRAHTLNPGDGWAWLDSWSAPDVREPAAQTEAAALFVHFLFTDYPLRKLYATVGDTSARVAELLSRLGFVEVARDRALLWTRGSYADRVHLQLTRADWERQSAALVFEAEVAIEFDELGSDSQWRP